MTLPDFSPVYPDEQAAMTEAFSSINIDVTYAPITGDQVVGSIIGGQWPANFFTLTTGSPFEMKPAEDRENIDHKRAPIFEDVLHEAPHRQ